MLVFVQVNLQIMGLHHLCPLLPPSSPPNTLPRVLLALVFVLVVVVVVVVVVVHIPRLSFFRVQAYKKKGPA